MEYRERIREIEANEKLIEEANSKRESWMMLPPEAVRLPTGAQMQSRSFKSNNKPVSTDHSGWTALPSLSNKANEKEVLKGENMGLLDSTKKQKMTSEEQEMLDKVKSIRGAKKSLMDQFAMDYATGKTDVYAKEKDSSQRPFDREKDVLSRRIGASERENLVKDSKNLDSKFSHGKKVFL